MRKILFYYPTMHNLAVGIAHETEILLGKIIWNHFEDGLPNTTIQDVSAIRGADVSFLASFSDPHDILEQLFVIRALPRYGARRLRVILPYFPGTKDRVDHEGEIATAKSLARELESIPFCRDGGPAELVVFDIHSLQERFYFNDNIVPRLLTAIPLLQEQLRPMRNVAIAFPDEGAWKRFGDKFPRHPHITCHKIRADVKRIVTIKEGEPRGKDVVIVDDLVKTGGTLLECQKVLTKAGAKSVSAYVTHGVFPGQAWRRFTDGAFKRFWITDSCPQDYLQSPILKLSLSGTIKEVILGE